MGTLRIIAGELRGRRFRVPAGGSVRPTPDRVREALFSILGPGIEGLRVLELYAGSGALGFEALSRGAASVTFVESDEAVRGVLARNATDLGVEGRCGILAGEVEALLARPGALGGPFDLVLADPPYGSPPVEGLPAVLDACGALAPGARLVVQRDRRTAPDDSGPGGPDLARTARYGRNCLDFFTFRGQRPG